MYSMYMYNLVPKYKYIYIDVTHTYHSVSLNHVKSIITLSSFPSYSFLKTHNLQTCSLYLFKLRLSTPYGDIRSGKYN